MKHKLIGNWDNQHSARFNAMLGSNFILIGVFITSALIGTPYIIIAMFFIANCVEMGGAYYFFKHPEKYPEKI